MILLGLIVGSYAYIIFFLGLIGLLYRPVLLLVTFLFVGLLVFVQKDTIRNGLKKLMSFSLGKQNVFFTCLVILFILQALINLIGALGPEIGFDALWYHLTLPKLYVLHHAVYHVPGGLLHYSDMPKLIDMLFVPALAFGNEVTAKLIEYALGILTVIVLYKLSRKMMTTKYSLITVLIFYTNLVVGWESTSAYIDLGRAFFEVLALYSFIMWYETKQVKNLIVSAIFVGFATGTKLLGLGSLAIFLILIAGVQMNLNSVRVNVRSLLIKSKFSIVNLFPSFLIYLFIGLLIPLPWFIYSYIHTGNPVYPFFGNDYSVHISASTLLDPLFFIQSMQSIFLFSPDPTSPLYLIFLPAIVIVFSRFPLKVRLIGYYSLFGLIIWYITPQTGGGRFIIPYLPAFSILCAAVLEQLNNKKTKLLFYTSLGAILFVALISIGYRLVANAKYIPFIVGRETKNEFLANHLNFHFGDFADIDDYFANHIKSNDTVLLVGFHNLYYVDFPFIDSSWVKKGDQFRYIAVQNSQLPERFKYWQLIYNNDKTWVKLYKPPKGECQKLCLY